MARGRDCRRALRLVSEHVDERLNARERVALERHLEGCSDCRREYETLRFTASLLRSLPEPRAPRSFALERRPMRAPARWAWGFSAATALTAAALVFVFAADQAGLGRETSGPQPEPTAQSVVAAQDKSEGQAQAFGAAPAAEAPAGKGGGAEAVETPSEEDMLAGAPQPAGQPPVDREQAVVRVVVEASADTQAAADEEVATRMSALTRTLKEFGVKDEQIAPITQGSEEQQLTSPAVGATAARNALFSAVDGVEVTLDQPDQVGALTAAALANGASRVEKIAFDGEQVLSPAVQGGGEDRTWPAVPLLIGLGGATALGSCVAGAAFLRSRRAVRVSAANRPNPRRES